MRRGLLARACAVLLALALPAGAEMVTLHSVLTGHAVGVDASGLLAVRRGPAVTLDMIRLAGNRVAFRDPQSGLFLRAGIGAQTQLGIASEHIRAWETFELHQTVGGVSLLSVQSGAWVGFDGVEPRLNARWGTQGRGQAFHLVPAGGAAAAAAPLPFAGSWVLDELFGGGRPLGLDVRVVQGATLQIGADGALDGHSGCNSFSAQMHRQGTGFQVGDFLTTRVGCQAGRSVERMLYSAITGATQVTLFGNRLELRDIHGLLTARFIRR